MRAAWFLAFLMPTASYLSRLHSAVHITKSCLNPNSALPSAASRPFRRLNSVQCCEDDHGTGVLSSAAEALPVIGCVAAGAPWFAAVYVPLIALSRQVGAPSGLAALTSSLLYSAGSALLGCSSPLFELPMFFAALGVLGAQIAADIPEVMQREDKLPPSADDVFASFDARLDARLVRRRMGEDEEAS